MFTFMVLLKGFNFLQLKNWVINVSTTRHASTAMRTRSVFRCVTMRFASVPAVIIPSAIRNQRDASSVRQVGSS